MDPFLIAITGRAIERIVVVVFGGLSIYFGYKLFLALPTQQGGDGKLQLPGIRLVLSKAAPGTFFVTFGVVLLATSFQTGIKASPDGSYSGMTEQSPAVVSDGSRRGEATPQSRARVQLAIQTLNCLQRASDGRGLEREDIELAATDAKLALLYPVWDATAWGDYNAFERWARQGAGNVPKAVKQVYEATATACRTGKA